VLGQNERRRLRVERIGRIRRRVSRDAAPDSAQRSFSASLAAEPWRVEPPHHRNYRWSTGSRFSKRFWKSKLKSFAGDTAIILI
jgi:hypothetical protein